VISDGEHRPVACRRDPRSFLHWGTRFALGEALAAFLQQLDVAVGDALTEFTNQQVLHTQPSRSSAGLVYLHLLLVHILYSC
jgi:hypothetical protein